MTVLIKRYANRKLYNTQTSRYITLKGIAELLEADEDVRVIDNETGEDITSIALSQILVDNERSKNSSARNPLADLLQRGGDALYDTFRRGVDDANENVGEFQKSVRRLLQVREERTQRLADWMSSSTAELEEVVQNAVERVFKLLDLPRRSDIEALNQNLERVAEAVESLESKPRNGAQRSAPASRAADAPASRTSDSAASQEAAEPAKSPE